ncbi:hypothetical protein LTS10_005538 [Elasticomyces elasticus]|nr:hypothetical protein LTS10_005538 [Elasticomyces elasticus]
MRYQSWARWLDLLGIVGPTLQERRDHLTNYICRVLIPDLVPHFIVAQAINNPHRTIGFPCMYERLMDSATDRDKYTRTQIDWSEFDRTDIYCLSLLRITAALARASTLAEEYGCPIGELPKWPVFVDYALELHCAHEFMSWILHSSNKPRLLNTVVNGQTGLQVLQQATQAFLATSDFESHTRRLAEERTQQRHNLRQKKTKILANNGDSTGTAVDGPSDVEDIVEEEGWEDEQEMFGGVARAAKRARVMEAIFGLDPERLAVSTDQASLRVLSVQSSSDDELALNEPSPDLTHKRKRGRADVTSEREAASSSFLERPVLAMRRRQPRLPSSDSAEANTAPARASSERSSVGSNEALVDSIEVVAEDNAAQHEPANDNNHSTLDRSLEPTQSAALAETPAAVPARAPNLTIKLEDPITTVDSDVKPEPDLDQESPDMVVKVEGGDRRQQTLDARQRNALLLKVIEEKQREDEDEELKGEEARGIALERTLAKIQSRIDARKGLNQEVVELD